MNFWQKLAKPIIGLSPMDGVTDAPYRYIAAKYGKPDVIFTEFISVDGIEHGAEGVFTDFLYHPLERPIVAQVFGNDPELFYLAAQVVAELGFDGMDINMGCPSRSVASRGAGAALIETPDLAKEIIASAKQGVSDWVQTGAQFSSRLRKAVINTQENLQKLGVELPKERALLPVSVKTRIGYQDDVVEEWIGQLLESRPANISVHGRTLKQMYQGDADWEAIGRGAEVTAAYNQGKDRSEQITYLGNGDISAPEQLQGLIAKVKMDGVLVGRAGFGNPWVFEKLKQIKDNNTDRHKKITIEERFAVAYEHSLKHWELKGEKAFVQMRKHLGWYGKGIFEAAQLRSQLVRVSTPEEVKIILDDYLDNNKQSN